eukprot:9374420-Alexandrium_andersonii.AAC.1
MAVVIARIRTSTIPAATTSPTPPVPPGPRSPSAIGGGCRLRRRRIGRVTGGEVACPRGPSTANGSGLTREGGRI